MSHQRRDSDESGWVVGLAILALFFAFILLWQALKILGAAFACQPKNPILWALLAVSIILTIIACAAQGDPVAVTFAGVSWTALIAIAAIIARGAQENADKPARIDTAVRNQWWD